MMPASADSGRLVRLVLWLLVFVAGAWLRLWQLDIQILIDDEWHAVHRLLYAGYRDIFLSLGHADYSIPLTLLFNFLAETVGLTEWRMRALPLAFGVAAIGVIPAVLRPWLDGRERLMLAALLACSPLLIHFSRYVRPYAPVVVLGFVAMVMLWLWWREGGRGRASAFFLAAVISAWLHPLSTLFTGAALFWFGVSGIVRWWQTGRFGDLGRVLLLGGVTTGVCCALLLPPLVYDPWSVTSKTGMHAITATTLVRSWEMIVGTGGSPLAVVMLFLAALGGWQWWRRDRWFMLYWAWMLAVVMLVVWLLDPAWIHNALVLVRYTAIAQPIFLAMTAIGVVWVASRSTASKSARVRTGSVAVASILLLAALVLTGPFPKVYRGINQFTNSVRYQLDYDFQRSVYHEHLKPVTLPAFYERIGREPGDWEIVETAWHFETHFTPISEYQLHHQLPVRIGMISGLCSDWTYGELDPGSELDIRLDRFVFLRDLLEQRRPQNVFLVFHRSSPFPDARELPDTEPCIEAFRERTGEPWHESEDAVVFRLPAPDPADDA